jgi:hypothetical protein
MSDNYQAQIIYGFPIEYPTKDFLGKDERGGQMYLCDWLEQYKPLVQINAGTSNGGTPQVLVGIVLHELDDFTRSTPHMMIPERLSPPDGIRGLVTLVASQLAQDASQIGYHLIGNRG